MFCFVMTGQSLSSKNHGIHDTTSGSASLTVPRKEALDQDRMSQIHSVLSKSQLQAWSCSDLGAVHWHNSTSLRNSQVGCPVQCLGIRGTDRFKVCHERSYGVAVVEVGGKPRISHTRAKRRRWLQTQAEKQDDVARGTRASPQGAHSGSHSVKQSPVFLSRRDGEESLRVPDSIHTSASSASGPWEAVLSRR